MKWATFLEQFGEFYAKEPPWRKALIEGTCDYYSTGILPPCLPVLSEDGLPPTVVCETRDGRQVVAKPPPGKTAQADAEPQTIGEALARWDAEHGARHERGCDPGAEGVDISFGRSDCAHHPDPGMDARRHARHSARFHDAGPDLEQTVDVVGGRPGDRRGRVLRRALAGGVEPGASPTSAGGAARTGGTGAGRSKRRAGAARIRARGHEPRGHAGQVPAGQAVGGIGPRARLRQHPRARPDEVPVECARQGRTGRRPCQ